MTNQEHIIRVKGTSSMKVAPDQLSLMIRSVTSFNTNEEASKSVYHNINLLNKLLKDLDMQDIKAEIWRTDVSKSFEFNKKKNSTSHFDADLAIQLKIDINRPGIQELILNISKEMKDASLTFSRQLKNPDLLNLQVLSAAIKDAETKANVMVQACGYKLESIKEIDELSQRGSLFADCCFSFSASEQNTTKNKDVTVSADVSVVWNIVKA